MKKLLVAFVALTSLSAVHAAVECTKEPVSKWKDQAAFQKELEAKYEIKKFKVTAGNCYEIYGWDKEKKKVEIYFNPVTGAIVKQR